jgi:hypothetical protein
MADQESENSTLKKKTEQKRRNVFANQLIICARFSLSSCAG